MVRVEHFITGDGCRIAYRLDGEAARPVLTLSNSIATDHRMWDDQIAALTRRFRVLRYDTRGHGGSDAPVGPYSLDQLGRDVVELLDMLAIDRTHFCGLSLGGFVGQWLGVRAPERIIRLVLSNTAPHLPPPTHWDGLITSVLTDRNVLAMADMFIGNWFSDAVRQDRPEVVARFRATAAAMSPDGLAGCFAVVRDTDLRRTNTLIDLPTLVIGGRDDTVTLASHSEQIAHTIRGAALLILPGVHLLNVEAPDAFMAAIDDFLCDDRVR